MLSLIAKRQKICLISIRTMSTQQSPNLYKNLETNKLKKQCKSMLFNDLVLFTCRKNTDIRFEYLNRLNKNEKKELHEKLYHRYVGTNILCVLSGVSSICLLSIGILKLDSFMSILGGGLYGLQYYINTNIRPNHSIFILEIDRLLAQYENM